MYRSIKGEVLKSSEIGDGYYFGGIAIDTSASSTSFAKDQLGTRALIFDGPIWTADGIGKGDASGGRNFVPGFPGIGGVNSSITGFLPISNPNPQPEAVVTSPTDTTAALTDKTRPVSSTPASDSMSATESTAVEPALGVRPAAMADLGRGASVSGAASDVFRRSYPLVSTRDGVICNAAGAKAGSAEAGALSPAILCRR